MRTKFNTTKVRNNLTKSKSYKKRNWPKYMEKLEAKKNEATIIEKPCENILTKPAKNTLERSPQKDVLDFSGEEEGFFKVGDKIIATIFPR